MKKSIMLLKYIMGNKIMLFKMLSLLFVFSIILFVGCGILDSNDKENVCDKVTSSGMPPIELSENGGWISYTKQISDITYDSSSRIKDYRYDDGSHGYFCETHNVKCNSSWQEI